jgi:hypothetical protein
MTKKQMSKNYFFLHNLKISGTSLHQTFVVWEPLWADKTLAVYQTNPKLQM